MQSVIVQLSGIAALFVLLHQLWSYAPIGHALILPVVVGTASYSILLIVHAVVRQVAAQAAQADDNAETEGAQAEPPADATPTSAS